MSNRTTINILNDSDFGSSVFCVCLFLTIIWFIGEPDFGDAVLHWMTDGRITPVAPVTAVKPAQPVVPVPVLAADKLNDGTDPFTAGAADTGWLIQSVPATVEPETEKED